MVSHLADDDRKLQASAIQSKNDLTMFHFFLASRASKNELNYYGTVEGKKTFFIVITSRFVGRFLTANGPRTNEGCNNRCLINYLN